MAVLWLSLGILLTALYFVSRLRGSVMPGHLSLIAITLFAALHQGVCLWITRRRLGGIRAASRTVNNYANSFIEVSFVSIAMLILVGSIEPALAMLGVPLLGYFLMLITSSLKLDSPLCVFAGVVAATQYGVSGVDALGGDRWLLCPGQPDSSARLSDADWHVAGLGNCGGPGGLALAKDPNRYRCDRYRARRDRAPFRRARLTRCGGRTPREAKRRLVGSAAIGRSGRGPADLRATLKRETRANALEL